MIRLIFFLLLVGCADPYTLSVDTTFSERESELIERAVEEWMIACDCDDASVFFRWDLPNDDDLITYEEWDKDRDYGALWRMTASDPAYMELIVEREGHFRGLHSRAGTSSKIALVVDRIDNEYEFYHVILHELGHMYGIEHQLSGVMRSGSLTLKIEACIDWRALSVFCDMHDDGARADPTCGR